MLNWTERSAQLCSRSQGLPSTTPPPPAARTPTHRPSSWDPPPPKGEAGCCACLSRTPVCRALLLPPQSLGISFLSMLLFCFPRCPVS